MSYAAKDQDQDQDKEDEEDNNDDEEAIKAKIIQRDDDGWTWRTDLKQIAAVDVAYET